MASSNHESTARAILYAFLANFGIALAKSWGAWITGSGSMLAEAIHSYADTVNQVLLFLGLKQSQKPADEKHPLGYGKLSYFWSFIVAMLLFSVGGLFSIYEGLHKFNHPEPLNNAWIAIVILVVAIVLESLSLLGCLREISHIRGEQSFAQWLRNTRNSALVVVFGEDTAALLGLTLALIFITLAAITGNPMFDAVGSMCIGVVLVVISVFLTARVKALLVGTTADPLIVEEIEKIIQEEEAVEELLNAITVQFGPDTMLAAKIKLRADIDLKSAISSINAMERRLKKQVPELRWCFIEPDTTD